MSLSRGSVTVVSWMLIIEREQRVLDTKTVCLTRKLQIHTPAPREPLVCSLQITGGKNMTEKGEVGTCAREVKMAQGEMLDHSSLSV